MVIPKEDVLAVRARILEAAFERFRQYGFGKTTMAEIASDCGMSAANLYRYFENKQDIGAEMTCQCLASKAEVMSQVVNNDDLNADEKIEAFLLTSLRYTHEQWFQQPRMNELVDVITQCRTDLVDEHLSQTRGMLKAIVEQGIEAGEFASCDVEVVSEALLSAMFIFDYPNLMGLYSLEEFERKARAVAQLLLNGLKRCPT